MKFTSVAIFVLVLAVAFAMVSATPAPWNLGKELEGIGQRVRDAIINAKPAVDTIADAQRIIKGGA